MIIQNLFKKYILKLKKPVIESDKIVLFKKVFFHLAL